MYVVAVGTFGPVELEHLRAAAGKCDLALRAFDRPAEAAALLKSSAEPPSGFFATRPRSIAALSEWVRERADWLDIPIVALVERTSEGELMEAFAAGADDALAKFDVDSLCERLSRMRSTPPVPRPAADNGVALVAMPAGSMRRWIGQVLRKAGFSIQFAGDEAELATCTGQGFALAVASTDLAGRDRGETSALVRNTLGTETTPLLVLDSCEAFPGETKSKILFLADMTIGRRGAEQRRSERIQHATVCAFRERGTLQPALGLTHNISREGMYVRTLVPPEVGATIWLEVRTIDGEPVHLRGRVMWRRVEGGGTTPAGFGMQIDAGQTTQSDLEAWERGYEALLAESKSVS